MGKSLPSAATADNLHQLGKITTLIMRKPKPTKTPSQNRSSPVITRSRGGLERKRKMENENINCSSSSGDSSSDDDGRRRRIPLSRVVSDCMKRWFQDALKEAEAGDVSMQVLVGQMYYNGYGVPKDVQKANNWMARASRVRSSVWNVSNKRPGYHASDSDSDESNGNS